ncbi:MAG: helix-turn-helix domain-containing protein [Ruminococcus sp.]
MIFKNIRALREDKDLKQRQIAEYLGVSQNTYSQYETGVIALTDQVIIKLADFYGVSTDYLLDRTTTKEPYPSEDKN